MYLTKDSLYKTTFQLVDKPDQLFPLFVMQVMGDIPCIPGKLAFATETTFIKDKQNKKLKILYW